MQRIFAYPELTTPHPDLYLTVVIPCLNEPKLVNALESIYANVAGDGVVEIYIIINHSEQASQFIKNQNRLTAQKVKWWIDQYRRPDHNYILVKAFDLPHKHAGVGLARKVGMDLASQRLGHNETDGIICNLDADCMVSSNYCARLIEVFAKYPQLNGVSIYYEHREDFEQNIEAIVQYELHLRLYVQALRKAGFTFAFHTVGSSMACRNSAYIKQGGMNRRKAGEDFYFIQKLLRLGEYQDLVDVSVFPSCRASERVPFGTGKAMGDIISGNYQMTYSLSNYLSVQYLFTELDQIYLHGFAKWIQEKPDTYHDSYLQVRLPDLIEEAIQNSGGFSTFCKRFRSNFDGFKVMKLLHHGRSSHWPDRPVIEVAGQFMGNLDTPSNMLSSLRKLERNHPLYLDGDLNVRQVE